MKPQRTYELKIVLGVLMLLGAYCGGSGRVDLWPGWWYAGFFLVTFVASYRITARVAPDLIVERVSWSAGAKRWDRPIVFWLMFAPIVTCLVAGLEARRYGVPTADWRPAPGYGLALAGSALTLTAMSVNRFYSPVMRIRAGHQVVDAGPYRLMRHPGAMGNLMVNVGTPWMLASRWAWIPAGISIALTIVRTTLEDRTLLMELAGYAAYAERTRKRLVPGIW